ncbi:MAG: PaaX family transcriptional regulator C-terminal domain-containing protein [Microthrixaceae bacterium]
MSPERNTRAPASPPLAARSVLASVLLGTEPPWLPTPLLVRTTALFGITEGATRTALSRLVARGEAVAERGGYRLVGRLVARQARQAASRRAETVDWDGTWELAIVRADAARSAPDRAALRDAMRALRFVELREGAWARPANLPADRSPESMRVAERWCQWWRTAAPAPRLNPASLWDLAGWAATARSLQREMRDLVGPLEAGRQGGLADGFVVSASVLRHLQSDPLLPPALLPDRWPGEALRADYDRFDAAYRSVLRTWFDAAASAS